MPDTSLDHPEYEAAKVRLREFAHRNQADLFGLAWEHTEWRAHLVIRNRDLNVIGEGAGPKQAVDLLITRALYAD